MPALTRAVLLAAAIAAAHTWRQPHQALGADPPNAYLIELPAEQRTRFRNTDGSCVQCSLSMAGVAANVPAAQTLLWASEFGPALRGGSDPARVTAYCNARAIKAWNVTGPQTTAWVLWALRTGRPAAITWGPAHMITALGISDDGQHIALCDNNSPQRIDWVTIQQFTARHQSYRGGWAIILDTPRPAGPSSYTAWW